MHLFFSRLENQFKKVEYFLLLFSGVTLFFIMLLVTIDVIMRNLFSSPLVGVFELVSMILIGVIVFGFSYVQGQKEHIIIEVATNSLPPFYKNLLDLSGYAIGLLVVSIITWQSGLNVVSSFVNNEYTMGLLRIPLWPSKFVLALGMMTLTIRLLLDIGLLSTNLRSAGTVHTDEKNYEKVSVNQ